MSFGRKGLAAGQATAAQPSGGFGRAQAAQPAERPERGAEVGVPSDPEADEIAARREAFIAAERARAAGQLGQGEVSDIASSAANDLAGLHNAARPAQAARPTQAARPSEPRGENGLPQSQEEQIKAMARSMAAGGRSRGSAAGAHSAASTGRPAHNPWAGKRNYVFGDPLKRNLIVAYVMWYFAGGFGIHRAYCGYMESGLYQVALLVVSVVILFIFPPFGMVGLAAWAVWMFADLFLMPGMMRRFKAAHEYTDTSIFE